LLNTLNSMTNDLPFAPYSSDVDEPLCATINAELINFASKYQASYTSCEGKLARMTFKYEVMKSIEEYPDGSIFTRVGRGFITDKRFSRIADLVDHRVLEKYIILIVENLPTEIEI